MNLITLIIGILIGLTVIVGILYVVFGQVTVRKLRKSPDTQNALGIEFASGLDIINVAQALAIPKSWARKLKNSPLSFLYADVDRSNGNIFSFIRYNGHF